MLLRNFLNMLKRYKVASLLNILGLSFAFAAFAIIMMQVRFDLTYDKFHTNADGIFRFEQSTSKGIDKFQGIASRPVLKTIREKIPEVEALTFFDSPAEGYYSIHENSGEYPYKEVKIETTPELFDIFDFNITAGDISRFNREDKIVIPESQSARLFPGQNPVGKFLYPNDKSQALEIVAVYRDFPANSYLKNRIYQVINNRYENQAEMNMFSGFLRLSSSSQQEAASRNIESVLYSEYPELFKERTVRLTSLSGIHYLNDVDFDNTYRINKTALYSLILVAILTILIAVINFTNFSSSLVPIRLRAVNTRKIMGASVRSIRLSMIFEAVGICIISVCFSMLIIHMASLSSLNNLLQNGITFSGNGGILWGAVLVALLTGVTAGIYPAYYITSFSPALALKRSFGLSPKGRMLRTALIGSQYVISFTLILTAVYINQQNSYIRNMPLGFDQEHILTANIIPSLWEKQDELYNRLKENPDVSEVAFSVGQIVNNSRMGLATDMKGEVVSFDALRVSPTFPRLMGLNITEGRDFRPEDKETRESAWIFNETAKAEGFEINQPITTFFRGKVIGFSNDFNSRPLHYGINNFGMLVSNSKFLPPFDIVSYFKVNEKHLAETVSFIRETIGQMSNIPAQEVNVEFLDQSIGQFYEKEKQMGGLITSFSILAILISLAGIFGLILFETQYRRKEIGLRKINGATITGILVLLNQNFIRIVCICFVIAAPVAYYFIREWGGTFTYRAPISIWIFILALLVVLSITLLTVTLQSWRAATENPVKSIKSE